MRRLCSVRPYSFLIPIGGMLLAGCTTPASSTEPPASSSVPSASASLPPAPQPSASAPAAAPVALQLLKFSFTSEVKNKMPVDTLEAAEPGQRVWGHFILRNRNASSRKLSVVFRVNGQARTSLDLEIDKSWSFRTYAFNTLRSGDKSGEISLEAKDETGAVIASGSIPIRIKTKKKALAPGAASDSN